MEILQVDMYAFFVSVEKALDPSIKVMPIVLGVSIEGRVVVSAVSYGERKYGIHYVISNARAKRLY